MGKSEEKIKKKIVFKKLYLFLKKNDKELYFVIDITFFLSNTFFSLYYTLFLLNKKKIEKKCLEGFLCLKILNLENQV